jgi:hypothetical protein
VKHSRLLSNPCKKTAIGAALAVVLGTASPTDVRADIVSFAFSGVFSLLTPDGVHALANTSLPYYYDTTWHYGLRTQISGSMSIDTITGAGMGTIAPFDFCNSGGLFIHDLTVQAIGNGSGGYGSLILGNMLFNWSGNAGIPVSIVWDASGLINSIPLPINRAVSGVGATPASNSILNGIVPIGPALLATTTWNTTTVPGAGMGTAVSGTMPLAADTVAGSPMIAGPFTGYNANFDITTISVVVETVPVPAAIWLFGSGLFGLAALAQRRKIA